MSDKKEQTSGRPDVSVRVSKDNNTGKSRRPYTATITFFNGMEEMMESLYVALVQNASGRLYFEKSNADAGGVRLDTKYHRIQTARVELVKMLSVWEGDYDLEQEGAGACFIRLSARRPIPGTSAPEPKPAQKPAVPTAVENSVETVDKSAGKPGQKGKTDGKPAENPQQALAPAPAGKPAQARQPAAKRDEKPKPQAPQTNTPASSAPVQEPKQVSIPDTKPVEKAPEPARAQEPEKPAAAAQPQLVAIRVLADRLVSQVDPSNADALATAVVLKQLISEL